MYWNSMNSYHHSNDYLSCKRLMAPGSNLVPINALQDSFNHSIPYLPIVSNIVMVFITILENYAGLSCNAFVTLIG